LGFSIGEDRNEAQPCPRPCHLIVNITVILLQSEIQDFEKRQVEPEENSD